MQWSKKTVPRLPLHQISRKASEQVIWLRIPHLLGEIPNQIICSLGRLRLRLRRVKACQKDFWRIYDLGSLLVAIKPFQLKLFLVFLKSYLVHLPCNEVYLRSQFPLHIFSAFLSGYNPSLPFFNSFLVAIKPFFLFPPNFLVILKGPPPSPTLQWSSTTPKLPLHVGWKKAFEQVIWLRIPHLMGEIPSQIICSLGRSRMWLISTTPAGRIEWLCYVLSV